MSIPWRHEIASFLQICARFQTGFCRFPEPPFLSVRLIFSSTWKRKPTGAFVKKEGKYMFTELKKPLAVTAAALFASVALTTSALADECDDSLSMVTEAAASAELTA